MILARYTELRRHFALVGASTAADGLPAWPGPLNPDGSFDSSATASRLRADGFSSTLYASTSGVVTFANPGPIGPLVDPAKLVAGDPVWPLEITCNAGAQDSVYGVHEYDWYVALRRDPGRYPSASVAGGGLVEFATPAFTVAMPDPSSSGRIWLTPNAGAVAQLLPGLSGAQLLTAEAFGVLFKNVLVFASRRLDRAFQWAWLYRR